MKHTDEEILAMTALREETDPSVSLHLMRRLPPRVGEPPPSRRRVARRPLRTVS
ncbi:hypothetical protein GCM10017562_74950 [Streptomyces roseofulvus]